MTNPFANASTTASAATAPHRSGTRPRRTAKRTDGVGAGRVVDTVTS